MGLLLDEGPLDCTVRDLANRLGVSYSRLCDTLHWLRRPEIIAQHGWTVPFQPPGASRRFWRVIDADDVLSLDERESVHASTTQRRELTSSICIRTKAQVEQALL